MVGWTTANSHSFDGWRVIATALFQTKDKSSNVGLSQVFLMRHTNRILLGFVK